ncbi:hypothetical protein N8J89_08170 [Crossiella sp. CA-258035]|uniref:peptidoglycan recognition protein family protein n=1 Tax=Crossiella sp. CA-258035 TaxID=2981138 RepID=UPI0024BC5A9D|nr:hypothetical protein [Crossiella sp. CA-258035]WHT21031.1 hypothetical protein N8J89_08170 [Crossiella sp. CA-258035]
MSVSITLRFVEIFRAHGVPVTFESGWERRGNGQTSAYEGGIVHHTATAVSNTRPQILVTGRNDLPGPLCNFAGLSGGGIHVVAANPANHAGASGGRSMGPLPVTTTFNRRVLGLEIVYPGTSPMTAAQLRTAKVFAKAVQQVFGSVERCRAHAETSITGKWDPGYANGRTIDMNQFRREAATINSGGFLMALSDHDQGVLLEAANAVLMGEAGKRAAGRTAAAIANTQGGVAELHQKVDVLGAGLAQVSEAVSRVGQVQAPQIDYPRLAAEVAPLIGDAVAQKVADVLRDRLAS